ncbi:MAG: protein kinase [Planctomycetota bacterium]|nr:protein kinase [Planctomycetota bacterium]
MPEQVSDEEFSRHLLQIGMARAEQVADARQLQTESAQRGESMSLADALVRQGAITPLQREEIEKRLRTQQDGAQQLGQYKLLKKLGGGAMGTVYLAEDTMAQRQVALKVLQDKYATDPEFLTRFRREAKAAGKLNHPNIVAAYTIGEEAGRQYYTMEYCQGETLGKTLDREKVLPWDTALAIITQVACGLQHAHKHGIIHRDIKPDNIFIADDPTGSIIRPSGAKGVAKILDLGLSKNIGEAQQSFYTQTGVAMGTPHYISPEQAKGEKTIDGRTDIYSLGATFYHLITGQTPFSGTTAAMVMMKHLSEQLPNPQDIVPDIPDGIVQVIQKMMAKDPNDRYADCAALLEDLEQVRQGKTPSSPAMDAARSTIAPRAVGRSVRSPHKRVARRQEPLGSVDKTLVGPRGASMPPTAARGRKPVYLAAGVLGLGAITFIAALAMRGANKSETAKPDTRPPIPDTRPAAVQPQSTNPKPETGPGPPPDEARWGPGEDLFDGKSLAGWKVPDTGLFARHGDVRVENGELVLRKGQQGTAAAWAGQFPSVDYELAFELKFPSPLVSFPVGTSQWAFFLTKDFTGESSAAVGPVKVTSGSLGCTPKGGAKLPVEQGKWYGVRLRIAAHKITATIDGQQRFEFDTTPHEEQGRGGDDTLKPLAVFTWQGEGAIRAIRLRRLKPEGAQPQTTNQKPQTVPWPLHDGKEPIADYAKRVGLPATETLDLGGGVKLGLVLIPPGKFTMGSPPTEKGREAGETQHEVTITKPFYMGKHEVTDEQFETVNEPDKTSLRGQLRPGLTYKWGGAEWWCAKTSAKTGRTVSLPTEAQWEYACRAGTTTAFSSGDADDDLNGVAWWWENADRASHPVGQKKPNVWGLYDMHGNVWEWCQDWYSWGAYPAGAVTDPQGPATGQERVMRGGSWFNNPHACRSAQRQRPGMDAGKGNVGFRVVVDVPAAVQPQTIEQKPGPRVTAFSGATQLGDYKLLSKFGKGTLGGDVFVAEDVKLGRKVLVEELPKPMTGDPAVKERFRRGAQALARLSHPNIVAVHSIGEEEGGTLYAAREYHEGEPLDALLKRDKALPWQRAATMAAEIAAGLKCAHDNRVILRDIKPRNIVVANDGKARILEFFLALDLKVEQPQAGVAVGTPQYMAPEQWRGDSKIDGRADIYALGATLCEMLTGAPPYGSGSLKEMMDRHLQQPLPDLKKLKPDLPDSLVKVIEKMLAKKPEDRYQNCDELLKALEALRQATAKPETAKQAKDGL